MIRFGFLITGLAIALNAFGYHALQSVFTSKDLKIFETATRYFLFGGLWVLLLSLIQKQYSISKVGLRLVVLGLSLFCGSLFLYLVFHLKFLMMITPLGGLLMICGFIYLSWTTK